MDLDLQARHFRGLDRYERFHRRLWKRYGFTNDRGMLAVNTTVGGKPTRFTILDEMAWQKWVRPTLDALCGRI